jgi:hypothetical protein
MRTGKLQARPFVASIAAILVLAAVAAPVSAASPRQVTIVSNVTFNPDGPNYGDFTASGQAVEADVICQSGTFVDTGIRLAGFESGRDIVQLQVDKLFTCADGTGSFSVKLQIQADFATGLESFSWVVLGGSGAYGDLRGSGNGSTVPNAPIGNVNTYEGFLLP